MARQDASPAALSFRDPSFTAQANGRAKPSPASPADDLDTLDAFDDINSQEILDLVLHEERQFATQQQQQQQADSAPSPVSANTPAARGNLYPRLAAHIPVQPASAAAAAAASSSLASEGGDELAMLRSENRRLRAEQAGLRAQMATREGEVRIVREHLARTEIDNTKLQEQVAARIALADSARVEAEQRLRREVDRLATALAFQQHDASTAAVQRTPARKAAQQPQKKAAPRGDARFPTAEDFAATPTATATATVSAAPADPPGDEDAGLLAMVADLGPSSGSLAAAALALSQIVRHPADSSATLALFTTHVLTPLHPDSGAEHGQRSAAVHLMLRALDGLPGFRDAWRRALVEDPEAVDVLGAALRGSVEHAGQGDSAAGELAGLLARLLGRLVGLCKDGSVAAGVWRSARVLSLAPLVASPHMPLQGVHGLLQLACKLSATILSAGHPLELERFLLASLGRLRLALVRGEPGAVSAEHMFLVLLASVMTGEASVVLINQMHGFARALVLWFVQEHRALSLAVHGGAGERVRMFVQYAMCLKVVLSEVGDVVELLGGEFDPAFFAFVAACTRLTVGERAFEHAPDIRELAADLLAYVVTEEQALSIQGLE
ncbi:hypothetical protein GGI15_001351 [Coemansia interrupta]|uniref:Uncharacterized protein n=1 Tax=Coemansia interrupta TaxID=1126814 RepID=A0A9W8HPE8_9FUNG|nr:hypothetical protein GGI15_001351 [Coemansia interrupta]